MFGIHSDMAAAICLIVNPVAGGGRATRRRSAAVAALSAVGEVHEVVSEYRGHETELAKRAAHDGARAIVVLGGDGSLSRVARGVVESGTRTPLGVLAAGTGNDFAKSLGAPVHDVVATAALVARGTTRTIDAGRIDGQLFVNSAGFGFDAEVLAHSMAPGVFRGTSRYAASALRQLFRYRGFEARFLVGDDNGAFSTSVARGRQDAAFEHWLTLVFANGCWFGGAFCIAPDARADDGMIDCIGIRDASPLRRAGLFARALRGTHVHSAAVRTWRAKQFRIAFRAPPMFQLDGELCQASAAVVGVEIVPGALEFFVG